MVSDVLFEAALEIKAFLRDWPKVYRPYAQEIHELLDHMVRVRLLLDQSPGQGKEPDNADH